MNEGVTTLSTCAQTATIATNNETEANAALGWSEDLWRTLGDFLHHSHMRAARGPGPPGEGRAHEGSDRRPLRIDVLFGLVIGALAVGILIAMLALRSSPAITRSPSS